MSLPARQQRALAGIEAALQASEPRLASMFVVFTELTKDEGPAVTERLGGLRPRVGGGIRTLVLIPVVFAMLITGAVLGGTVGSAAGCGANRLAGYSLLGSPGRTGGKPRPACAATGTGKSAKAASRAKPAARAAAPLGPLGSRASNKLAPAVLRMR